MVVCAFVTLVIAITAIYGWHTGAMRLVTIFEESPPLAHGFALGLVMAGAALLALTAGHTRIALIAGSLAAITGILGLLDTFGSYAAFDALRLPQMSNPEGIRSGPMGLVAALSLLLSGLLAALLARPMPLGRRHVCGAFLGVPTVIVGTLAFFGHLSGVIIAYAWPGAAPMAVHGAVAAMALGTGLCLYAWREDADWRTVTFLLWGVALPVAVIGIAEVYFGAWKFMHDAPHAALEAVGGVAGLGLAYLFYQQWKRQPAWELLVAGAGLSATGLLGLVHACFDDGHAFVWLYTLTNLVGGLVMVLVWLPGRPRLLLHRGALVWAVAVIALAASVLSTMFSAWLPNMLHEGAFTPTANAVNFGAGLLFFAAGERYIQHYRTTQADYAYTVALVCLVFGASGVLFQVSAPWEASWWAWHGLRLGAFVIGLLYITREMQRSTLELHTAHAQLQDQVEIIRRTSHERDVEHAQLLALFDGIEELIYVIDPVSRTLVYVNDTFRRAFGDDVLGRPYRAVLYGQDSAAQKSDDSGRILRNGSSIRVREMLNPRNMRWYRAATKPIRWADGRTLRFELAVDITDLKTTEDALRKAEERLRLALDSANMGTWQYEVASEQMHLDSHMLALFGLREAVSPIPLEAAMARVRREDRERLRAGLDEAMAGRDDADTQFGVVLESGFIRNLATRGTVYRGDQGQVTRIVGVCWDQTESMAAERALQESKARLQAVLDNSATLIQMKDTRGRYMLVNRKLADVLGRDTKRIIGLTDEDLWPTGVAAAQRESDAMVVASGAPVRREETVLYPDGNHTVYFVKVPLFDAEGKLQAIAAVGTDITERKAMEVALREREEHFRALMEQAADDFFVLNAEGLIVDVNRRACENLRYSRDALIGMGPWDLDPDFPPERVKAVLKQVTSETPVTIEGCNRRSDGTTIPVELRVGVIHAGGALSYLASARDITERRESERALRASENRLRSLTDTVPCAIYRCALDESWTMEYLSAQIEELTGYPVHEYIGNAVRTYASIIYPDDRTMVDSTIRHGIARNEPFIIDYRIVHASGAVRWVHEEGRGVHGENGTVGYLDGFILDQTVRMEAEQALQARTIELQQTIGELNRINEDLDQFAFVASHDLQEPLRTLITYSGFLQEDLGDALSESSREDFHQLASAAHRMQALVRDLLTFSRSGRAAIDRHWIPLDACVNDALANLRTLIEESQATIERQPLPDLEADHTLITQVFQNLIGNALKFRGEACPIITITAEHLQDRWVMGVKDNGIGIEPQYGELIFAPFKRLHSIREFPGSGIGLAVARRVIERHGGVIWVESAPGQGAHFRFTLGTWKGTQNVYDAQETRGDSPH
jgi:PAS domain S-box-containing protein